MSSVVIAGDTSGSVTLQAPATAGSVVVTLPSASGTMAVTGGSPSFTNLTTTGVVTAGGGALLNQGLYVTNANAPSGASGPALFGGYSSGGSAAFIQGYNSTTSAWVDMIVAGSTLKFNSGSSSLERMRIDSNGNVGINTDTPSSSGGKLVVVPTNTTGSSTYLALDCTNFVDSNFQVSISGSASTNKRAIIGTNTSTALSLKTADVERMRVTTDGKLIIANTATFGNGGLLEVDANSQGGNYNGINVRGGASSYSAVFWSSPGSLVYFTTTGTGSVGSITSNGSTTVYGTSSDYRLKENVAPMTGALQTVAKLKPVTYKWKNTGIEDNGFIAHELQAVLPNAVTGKKDDVNEDGTIKAQNVDTSYLVATLTAAIQELNAKVTALEAQLGAK